MGFIVSLTGLRPTPRYDGVAFTVAKISEGDSADGPFVELDEIPLSPLDNDPADPQERDFTFTANRQYGAWYQVIFKDAEGNEDPLPAIEGAAAPLPPSPRREWLARILQATPSVGTQTLIGDGQSNVFFLRDAPASKPAPSVAIGAETMTPGNGFTIDAAAPNALRFAAAPADGAILRVQYFTTVWEEQELAGYIAQAEKQYSEDLGVVYQAAIFAIDAVSLGMATALNFGAGQETYDLQSVYDRLMQLRETFNQWLVERQDEGAPLTVTQIYGDDIGAGDILDVISELDPLNWYEP